MKEKVLTNHKNGMIVLLLTIAAYLLAFAGMFVGIAISPFISVLCVVWLCIGWIFFLGLKVLGPQEALVLTLFGNYFGTIREPGFYFVNPFCTAVNPAAQTKLRQSGDVDGGDQGGAAAILAKSVAGNAQGAAASTGKKISLKDMTLSNSCKNLFVGNISLMFLITKL